MRQAPVPGHATPRLARCAASPTTALGPTVAPARAESPGGVVRVGGPADRPGGTAEAPGRDRVATAGFMVRGAGGGTAGAPVAAASVARRDKPGVGLTFARIAPAVAAVARGRDRATTAGAPALRGLNGPPHRAGDAQAPDDGTARAPTRAGGARRDGPDPRWA